MVDKSDVPAALSAMDKLFDGIVWICRVVTGVALVLMTIMFGWLVFGRYVLNATPTWVEQYSLLLIMLIAFLGAAVGVREHTHLSVVAFRFVVPTRVRTIMVLLTDTMMAAFGVVLVVYGAQLTMFKWNTMIPLIGISEGYRSLPLTIMGGLILLFSIGHIIRVLIGRDERADSIE